MNQDIHSNQSHPPTDVNRDDTESSENGGEESGPKRKGKFKADWTHLRGNIQDLTKVIQDICREEANEFAEAKEELVAKNNTLVENHRKQKWEWSKERVALMAKNDRLQRKNDSFKERIKDLETGLAKARDEIDSLKERNLALEYVSGGDWKCWPWGQAAKDEDEDIASLKKKIEQLDQWKKDVTKAVLVGGDRASMAKDGSS